MDVSDPRSVAQARYHEAYYEKLFNNADAVLHTGDSILTGPDQLGHLGASACDRIVDSIVGRFAGRPISCLELGSGVGGPMRYILAGLESRVDVRLAFGADIVRRHCEVLRTFGSRTVSRPQILTGCMSVTDLALRSATFDVVFVVGSAGQLPDMPKVLKEAYRVLAPGGLLTMIEEVGILADGRAPSPEFRAKHPPGVFYFTTAAERRKDLVEAGFDGIDMIDLSGWAADILRKRLLALKIYREDVETLYGKAGLAEIVETLQLARTEMVNGVVLPVHVLATRGY